MDNFYKNCPAKMQDQGRHLQNFNTATKINNQLRNVTDIYHNSEYRTYLQNNGNDLALNEFNHFKQQYPCKPSPCIHHYPLRSTTTDLMNEKIAYDTRHNPNFYPELKQCEKFTDNRMFNQSIF